MKNTILKNWFVLAFSLGTILLFSQCDSEDAINLEAETTSEIVDTNSNSTDNTPSQSILADFPKEDLSIAEKEGLQFMREEEKLAHDVYVKLYEKWGKNIFNNIAQSEATHTEAVLGLLNKYDLTDPVGNNEIGVFTNSDLQTLYNDLIEAGSVSLEEALKVGAAIEEIDIRDLEKELNENVDNEDITVLYQNLKKGSRNHLRAFIRNLTNRGVNYEPQYLTIETFEAIINSEWESGGH